MDQSVQLPWHIKAIIFAGAVLAAAGAVWIGVDLYSGLVHGVFRWVRSHPVTALDGFRYWLAAGGESLSVLILSGMAILLMLLATGRIPRQ